MTQAGKQYIACNKQFHVINEQSVICPNCMQEFNYSDNTSINPKPPFIGQLAGTVIASDKKLLEDLSLEEKN